MQLNEELFELILIFIVHAFESQANVNTMKGFATKYDMHLYKYFIVAIPITIMEKFH